MNFSLSHTPPPPVLLKVRLRILALGFQGQAGTSCWQSLAKSGQFGQIRQSPALRAWGKKSSKSLQSYAVMSFLAHSLQVFTQVWLGQDLAGGRCLVIWLWQTRPAGLLAHTEVVCYLYLWILEFFLQHWLAQVDSIGNFQTQQKLMVPRI